MRVLVIGAGVAGLATATELAERGADVEVWERGAEIGAGAASRLAGAMLSPWCERESAEARVAEVGAGAAAWWAARVPGVVQQGSLVLAAPRDRSELTRFARRTGHFDWVVRETIAGLEPDLGERFGQGLLFREEAHLCPRCALKALARRLEAMGATIHLGREGGDAPQGFDAVVDATGFGARERLAGLRGVRGEMLQIRSREVRLTRAVRLLHPRLSTYFVPRDAEGLIMVGATMIESGGHGPVTVRSALELLGAAYALHPALAEAEIVETAAHVRPAFPDNLPRVIRDGRRIHVNGLYRHGFLLGPAMAREAAQAVLDPTYRSEWIHEDLPERRRA